jgi:mxaL protein
VKIGRFRFDNDFALLGCALVLLIAAVLLPRVELSRDTYDYLVVFDVTQSMNVEDYELDRAPVDRLTYAKHAVRSALQELPCGSRIGWGAFAEYRTVVLLAPVEICSNYDDLLESLEKIDGRMRWGEASEITKGVFWALRAARDLGDGANVIFLSDGQEAPPLDATRQAVAIFEDITIGATDGWLVGVGGYAAQPIPRTDADGHRLGYWRAHEVIQRATDPSGSIAASSEHLSALHEAHLQSLASQIGFQYRRLSDVDTIEQTLRDARLAKQNSVPTDISWAPAALALLLLAIKFTPTRRMTRNPPRSRL